MECAPCHEVPWPLGTTRCPHAAKHPRPRAYGEGVEQDDAEALRLFREAAALVARERARGAARARRRRRGLRRGATAVLHQYFAAAGRDPLPPATTIGYLLPRRRPARDPGVVLRPHAGCHRWRIRRSKRLVLHLGLPNTRRGAGQRRPPHRRDGVAAGPEPAPAKTSAAASASDVEKPRADASARRSVQAQAQAQARGPRPRPKPPLARAPPAGASRGRQRRGAAEPEEARSRDWSAICTEASRARRSAPRRRRRRFRLVTARDLMNGVRTIALPPHEEQPRVARPVHLGKRCRIAGGCSRRATRRKKTRRGPRRSAPEPSGGQGLPYARRVRGTRSPSSSPDRRRPRRPPVRRRCFIAVHNRGSLGLPRGNNGACRCSKPALGRGPRPSIGASTTPRSSKRR